MSTAFDEVDPTGSGPVSSSAGGQGLQRIGHYEIKRQIGAGGMGAVFLATDTRLNRAVALKILPREKAKNPTLVRRFKSEAEKAAQLKHDNIVAVYDTGEHDGYCYIALEFVDGIDVHDLVARRGVLPFKRSLDIVRQTAHALQHAYEKGIVHRDIKPSNLLIRRDGGVKLADMGLARSIDESIETGITRAGTTVGTVDYMSPEQARDSKSADIRSDIYSLGCTWYHMLTGAPPYSEGSLTNKLRAHAQAPIPDPCDKNPNIPEGVLAILNRMMAKDPDQRYQTPQELIDDLERANISRAAVSEKILSSLADEESSARSAPSSREPAPAPLPLPPKSRLSKEESKSGFDPRVLVYAGVAVAIIGVMFGLKDVFRRYGNVFGGGVGVSQTNPFRDAVLAPLESSATASEADAGEPGAAPVTSGNPLVAAPEDPSRSPPQAAAPVTGGQPAVTDGTAKPGMPQQVATTAGSTTAPPTTSAGAMIGNSPAGSGTAASTTGGSSPGNRGAAGSSTSGTAGSAASSLPSWVNVPQDVGKLEKLTVRFDARGEKQFATLNEALNQVPPQGAVIELFGNGPFPLHPVDLQQRAVVSVRAAQGFRPLVVLVPDASKTPETLLHQTGGTLELSQLDLATGAEVFPGNEARVLVGVTSGHLLIRDCTFTLHGERTGPTIAAQLSGGGKQSRLLLDRTLVRGAGLSALQVKHAHAEAVVRESLFITGAAPAARVVKGAESASDADALCQVHLVRSTLSGTHVGLELAAEGANPAATEIRLRDSVVAASSSEAKPTLLVLQRWPRNDSPSAESPFRNLKWDAEGTLFLGWPQLLEMRPDDLFSVSEPTQWYRLWRESDPAQEFHVSTWPPVAAAGIFEAPLSFWERSTISVPAIQTVEGGVPGCPLEKIHIPNLEALPLGLAWRYRPRLPPPLPQDSVIRVDLTKAVDLGRRLEEQDLPDGATVVASGFGSRSSRPIVVKNKSLRIVFEQTDGAPLVITARTADTARARDEGINEPFITVINGRLELVNATFRIPYSDRQASPPWLVHAVDSNFAIRNCRLLAPTIGNTGNQGLIRWSMKPGTGSKKSGEREYQHIGLIEDTFLVGSGCVLSADMTNAALLVRNSVAVGPNDLFVFGEGKAKEGVSGTVVLDRSTLSAGTTFFSVKGASSGSGQQPLRFLNREVVFTPLAGEGKNSGGATLLRAPKGAVEQKQVDWWELACGYAAELGSFVRPDVGPASAARQSFEADWRDLWGQPHFLRALTGVGGVLLSNPVADLRRPQATQFELHQDSKAARWGEGGTRIGADVAALDENPAPPAPKAPEKKAPAAAPKKKVDRPTF